MGHMGIGSDDDSDLTDDDSPKKRRDLLTRRPSYRKILNDLGGGEIGELSCKSFFVLKKSTFRDSGGSMLSQNPGEQGSLHSGGTIVQYSGQDGSLVSYVPGKSFSLPSKYRLKSLIISVNLVGGNVIAEDQSRKREMRLLKNREAARECRRKKKEYIKCLENRVAVLENQNKALIEELKSLKELYCQQKND
jgi:cAMP response element-binding protein